MVHVPPPHSGEGHTGRAADPGTCWLARGEHELPATGPWLTPHEAARAAGMRFTKRRTEYLLRRFAGKCAVASAGGLPTDLADLGRIEIANRSTGAPFVLVDGTPLGLDVSLTDRAGWAVCVVGTDLGRVGCDLELVEARSAAFVSDFLTPAEQDYVVAQPEPERDVAANLLWSAKESALKVLRTGLRRDTRTVEVTVEPLEKPGADTAERAGWGRLTVRRIEGGTLSGWWRRDGDFVLTVASQHPLTVPRRLAASADLAAAQPTHSWLDRPLTT